MIILTTPEIIKLNPKRISEIINWTGIDYCLAEVNDAFTLSEKEMEKLNIDFWWECTGGYFNSDEYFKEEHKNIIEGIYWTYDVSKEKNIALAIYEISRSVMVDEIEFFNQSIKQ